MNQQIYVTVDETGFITDFKLTAADGYQAVTVPLAWIDAVMKYPKKFRVVNGALAAPGNLPSISVNELKQDLDKANNTIADQQTTITKLQQLAGTLTGQIALMGASQTTPTKDGE